MNWRRFKELFKTEKITESQFVLGIDLGNATSAIAYYDVFRNQPEVIDLSGGYGKPSTPTVIQYIKETKEWVFGEYAILNRGVGKEITFEFLIDKLGKKHFIEIDNKAISVSNILGYFIKDLIRNCRNLNPKAEIAGIIVSTPPYISQEAIEELYLAFKIAGYDKELIDMVSETLCIFKNYFHINGTKNENILLLDFGGRALREGIYSIQNKEDEISLKSVSFMQSDELGTMKIDEAIIDIFEKCYADFQKTEQDKLQPQIKEQIASFAYQHKELLFQKNLALKPIKLYFNFSYPPFQKTIDKAFFDDIIGPFENKFKEFLNNLYYLNEVKFREINTVICSGGGFEMYFAKKIVQEKFLDKQIYFFKNSKCVVAEGASILAAAHLALIPSLPISLTDMLKLNYDMGFMVTKNKKERFIPVSERNSFWQQSQFTKSLIVNEAVSGEFTLNLYRRNENGDVFLVNELNVSGLPPRPKGATCLKICLEYESVNSITATVIDQGFGEMFPKSDYLQEYKINI